MIAELDDNNTLLALYTQSGMRTDDTLAVSITNDGAAQGLAISSGSYQFIKDGLGSISSVTNSSGDILQKYIYSSFGTISKITDASDLDISSSPTLTPYFTYANREWDSESGLYYYRARYYDSASGRFIQSDPHPGAALSPITFINRFTYSINNSINFNDPSGASIFDKLGRFGSASLGFAIGGIHGVVAAVNVSGQFSQSERITVNVIYVSMIAGGADLTGFNQSSF